MIIAIAAEDACAHPTCRVMARWQQKYYCSYVNSQLACACTYAQIDKHAHAYSHIINAQWSVVSHYLWKHTNIYLHRYSLWEKKKSKGAYVSLSVLYLLIHALIELKSYYRGAECPGVCLQQRIRVKVFFTYRVRWSKLIASKCQHSDSKFTGSTETTRKLQKIKYQTI